MIRVMTSVGTVLLVKYHPFRLFSSLYLSFRRCRLVVTVVYSHMVR